MGKALDYSAGVPTAAAVKAAGYSGVLRYLKKTGKSSVHVLSAAEYADMTAHGIDVALVYEDTAPNRMLAGKSAGASDAAWAFQQARACGISSPRAIYYTADWDVQPSQYAAVAEYLDGAASVHGKSATGLYGGYDAIVNCGSHATWKWQTSAWSGGKTAPGIHVMQQLAQTTVSGVGCDVNTLLAADYGQHPTPAKPDPNEGDDMSAADVKAINAHIDRAVDEIRTETSEGNSIANVISHQNAQGTKLTQLQDDVDALAKTVAEILKVVQSK